MQSGLRIIHFLGTFLHNILCSLFFATQKSTTVQFARNASPHCSACPSDDTSCADGYRGWRPYNLSQLWDSGSLIYINRLFIEVPKKQVTNSRRFSLSESPGHLRSKISASDSVTVCFFLLEKAGEAKLLEDKFHYSEIKAEKENQENETVFSPFYLWQGHMRWNHVLYD